MDVTTSLRFTLAHHQWAIACLLDECEKLTPAQFDHDFGIGPGSLRGSIAHTIEVMYFFADTSPGASTSSQPISHHSALPSTACARS